MQEKMHWQYGRNGMSGFDSDSFPVIGKGQAGLNAWRNALAAGNGWTGLLESFDPREDVIIYQDTELVLDTSQIYRVPDYSKILGQERRNAVLRSHVGIWAEAAARENRREYGVKDIVSADERPYHPSAQLRIRPSVPRAQSAYNRYTNYQTGEIGGQWKDENGLEWNTRSFASRENRLVITELLAPDSSMGASLSDKLDLTIGLDHILEMSIEQEAMADYGIPAAPVTTEGVDTDGEIWIWQTGKYQEFPIGGVRSNPPSEFHDGGWATAVRIYTDGEIYVDNYVRDIPVCGKFMPDKQDTVIRGYESPVLQVKGAGIVILAAGIEHCAHGLKDGKSVKDTLLEELKRQIRDKTRPYEKNKIFSYEDALLGHRKLHEPAFSRVSLELCHTQEEKADRNLTNEALMEKQRQTAQMNKAYVERLFGHGRFALLCASGYHVPRMCGMWTGSWMPLFHGGFITNANLNLQLSSMNTGNLPEAAEGYIHFLLRQLPDWQTNAAHIYGMENALQAPVHTAGDGNGQAYHSLPGYPHAYCNAVTDWMIIPVFETYQCFGNRKIPFGEDLPLDRLTDICGYSKADQKRIRQNGFDLQEDILVPLLRGLMNFWTQYVDDRYYLDKNEKIHLADGTAIGEKDNHYLLTPGYSAENAPGGLDYNGVLSLAANTAMDIAAMRNSLYMAEQISRVSPRLPWCPQWGMLRERIPDYLYTDDGAVKEWALPGFMENDDHRHVSHAYGAWPAHEAQKDRRLRAGIYKAIQNRTRQNRSDDAMAHGHLHKAMAAARVKSAQELEKELYLLTAGEYQYTSLMTSHDKGHGSAFCTDAAITYPGIILEALVYSGDKEVEVLPALPDQWKQGRLCGVRTRCRAQVIRLCWDRTASGKDTPMVSLTLMPEESRSIYLKSGLPWDSCAVDGKRYAAPVCTSADPAWDSGMAYEKKAVTVWDKGGEPSVRLMLVKGLQMNISFYTAG
ncbi:glycosyl hydrolase family 95 catalytic domain-containing protein [Diplocloster modestus]|uniref:Glycosyl hydrolase family 95 catalytic domain-containing protein n=1 Tax=Diplocloster modestus TaxID=2850322 RepID=A0ABS6K6V9_9FIRM|nr:hypothetical protein [Diplocloster modestus]MBU9726260.1 hypothetical protein [Diplocloster modestus]